MKSSVYVFRGSPASGKSSVASLFAKSLGGHVALLEHDTFRWGIHLVGRRFEDVSDGEKMFAYRNLRLLYEEYLKKGMHTIVIEGLFSWDDEMTSQGEVKSLLECIILNLIA